MINHETRIIELGHGDVCVGESWSGLTFQNIEPAEKIGTNIFRSLGDINFLGETVELLITDINEISQFESKLQDVEASIHDYLEYKGWVIKFNGNWKSAEVVRAHFNYLKNRIMNCLAC